MASLSLGGVDHLTTLVASFPRGLNVERVSETGKVFVGYRIRREKLSYMHA